MVLKCYKESKSLVKAFTWTLEKYEQGNCIARITLMRCYETWNAICFKCLISTVIVTISFAIV